MRALDVFIVSAAECGYPLNYRVYHHASGSLIHYHANNFIFVCGRIMYGTNEINSVISKFKFEYDDSNLLRDEIGGLERMPSAVVVFVSDK